MLLRLQATADNLVSIEALMGHSIVSHSRATVSRSHERAVVCVVVNIALVF